MGDFTRCIDLILAEEGGQVNHPRDPGKLTQYGISQRAYPHLNIAVLTLEDAEEIYQRDCWTPIHGDQLSSGLDLLLPDSAVNQGPVTAVTMLQEALGIHMAGIPGAGIAPGKTPEAGSWLGIDPTPGRRRYRASK